MDKPATPLPWSIEKCRCGHRSCDQWVFSHAGSVGLYGDDARYAVHACNAYPHLTANNAELVELLALAAGLIDDQLGGDFPELLQDIRTTLARAALNQGPTQ